LNSSDALLFFYFWEYQIEYINERS